MRGSRTHLSVGTLGLVAVVTASLALAPGATAQTPRCFGQPVTIMAEPGVVTVGTSGNDVIWGTRGSDVIRGRGGNDLICSRGGNDNVDGGGGSDQIDLGGGKDVGKGGKGNDLIRGKGGKDKIKGGGGADQVIGGGGADNLIGGGGGDLLNGGGGADELNGGGGADQVNGGGGTDDCRGGGGSDVFTGCNEATTSIDLTAAYLDAEGLGDDWTVQQAPTLTADTALSICGVPVENDIGVETSALVSLHNSTQHFAQFGQLVRNHTDRTASELISRAASAAEAECTTETRDDANTADLTLTNIDPLDVTPMGDEFSVYHYDLHIAPDDSTVAETDSKVIVMQMRCGSLVARYWVWYSTPPITTETLDAITATVHQQLSSTAANAGIECAETP